MKTYWLSFVQRETALGVVITKAESSKAAYEKITAQGLNPGGEVMTIEIPDEPEAQAGVARFPQDKLLDPAHLLANGCIKKSEVGEYDPSKSPINVTGVCEECNSSRRGSC